jgi:hypothetical protein
MCYKDFSMVNREFCFYYLEQYDFFTAHNKLMAVTQRSWRNAAGFNVRNLSYSMISVLIFCETAGIVNEKTLPCPISLVTQIVP